MTQPAFSRLKSLLSNESYLTILLLALIEQCDGEIHISAQSLESIDDRAKLLVDWDTSAQQVVLRRGSQSLIVSEVRGAGWTTTQPAQPSLSPTATHRVITEEDMVKFVRDRIAKERMREWKEQGAAAISNMPPPAEPTQ